ncbi:vacuolar membrane protein [Mycena maculata]|uniref:Vacuolar membrane protein n=1 Tax=Mycena maculata TaxID=230809 RepID=A0AAD7KEH4_9AGAR|nr:vacuolar membrane protein [Mycena maculata]
MRPAEGPDSVGDTLEMDTLGSTVAPRRSVSRAHSRSPGRTGANKSRIKATRDYAVGIGLLLVVVVLWTSSNFVTQGMYQGGFEKPFLVTYLNTSAFALYLVPFKVRRWWRQRQGLEQGEVRRGRAQYQPLAADPEEVIPEADPPPILFPTSEDALPPLTIRETARLAFVFCFLWFIANWTVNAALDYTSVASATILSSMSGFFTLGIGRVFRVEKLTLAKIGAVTTSFAGVLLVSLSDSVAPKQPAGAASRPLHPTPSLDATELAPRAALGDILALISALFYALYVILLKVRIRDEARVDMQLFFGFVGAFNVLMCWPIGVFLHLIGTEPFELPQRKAVAALLINMGITLSSDYLYVLAMLKTTPLVVTVGLSLTIPLAVLGDFVLGRFTRGQVIFGALLVLLSFVVVGLDNEKVKVPDGVPSDDASDEQRLSLELGAAE